MLSGELRLAVHVERVDRVVFTVFAGAVTGEDVVGRHVDHLGSMGACGRRDDGGSARVYALRIGRLELAAIDVRIGGEVDDHRVARDRNRDRALVGDIELRARREPGIR